MTIFGEGYFFSTTVFSILRMKHDVWECNSLPQHNKHHPQTQVLSGHRKVVQFSCSVMSNSLRPHGLQHSRLPCPSPTPGVYSNSCSWSQWCHPTISSSVIPFSSQQSFPVSGSFLVESVLRIKWWKCWSFSFSISPSNEYSGLISFRIDWFDPFAVQGTLNSLLQHHSSKASVLQCSAFFMFQLSYPYITTGKTIALQDGICPAK